MQKLFLLVVALCAVYVNASVSVAPLVKTAPVSSDWECTGCVDFFDQ